MWCRHPTRALGTVARKDDTAIWDKNTLDVAFEPVTALDDNITLVTARAARLGVAGVVRRGELHLDAVGKLGKVAAGQVRWPGKDSRTSGLVTQNLEHTAVWVLMRWDR